MRPVNTIVILSDEHNRDVVGCYGDSIVRTPNIDALAETGMRFQNAYTNAPVCVPARASFATGRYPHQIGAWDSTAPYDGSPKGWAARLTDRGLQAVSIGKLHFHKTSAANGFSEEIIPMHVHNGTGWLSSLLRDPPVPISGAADMAGMIGPGETRYTAYDRQITSQACNWIGRQSADASKPWVLYIGLVAPHFPLIAPVEFFELYEDADIPPPRQYAENQRPRHPVLEAMRQASNYDDYFDEQKIRTARQSYYGLCSFLDDNVGKIVRAVTDADLRGCTNIIYTSDHGDNLGHRGFWGKSVMYEDSVAVPLIISGPNAGVGKVINTPASLIDLHPTILDGAGIAGHPDDKDLPGQSLYLPLDPERAIFSEYHDWSSVTGMFMLRKGDWKLVCYPGYASQLFNLRQDPEERVDLISDDRFSGVVSDMENALAAIVDTDAVNRAAFADQAEKIKAHGGRASILQMTEQGFTPPP